MAWNPGAFLRKRLGRDNLVITVMGQEVDLEREISVPEDDDIEEMLAEHVEREAAWRIMLARAKSGHRQAVDELREMEGMRFSQIHQQLYTAERSEYDQFLYDEGEDPDPLKRRHRASARLALGSHIGRFRPTFSDDRVQALVKCEPKIVIAKQAVRAAAETMDIIEAMVSTLDVRARALSHLCALHRDDRRR